MADNNIKNTPYIDLSNNPYKEKQHKQNPLGAKRGLFIQPPITRGTPYRYCKASLPTGDSDVLSAFPISQWHSGKNLSVTATSSSGNFTPFLFNRENAFSRTLQPYIRQKNYNNRMPVCQAKLFL